MIFTPNIQFIVDEIRTVELHPERMHENGTSTLPARMHINNSICIIGKDVLSVIDTLLEEDFYTADQHQIVKDLFKGYIETPARVLQ